MPDPNPKSYSHEESVTYFSVPNGEYEKEIGGTSWSQKLQTKHISIPYQKFYFAYSSTAYLELEIQKILRHCLTYILCWKSCHL